MATVHIPAPMRSLTGGESEISVAGQSLRELIDRLDEAYPGVKARLVDGDRIRPGFATFVDGESITAGLQTRLKPDSEIYFTPALAGG